MPSVIQIRRQPTGYETFGQSMQDLSNNFIQSMLSMAQQQNTQNMQMMGLGMQERRLADSNARDDRRWREQTAMQDRRFAQEDKWKEQQLALEKQRLGMAYGKNAEEMAANKRLNDFLNGMNSPASGGAGGGTPGLDAAANAAADEVLQPGWSPSSPMGRKGLAMFYPHLAEGAENNAVQPETQAPALAASHTVDPLAHAFDLLGVKFPQQVQPQAEMGTPIADSSPVQPSAQEMPQAPQMPQMPQMPEPASLTSGSVKITADNFPPQLLGSQRGQAVFNWLKSRDEAAMRKYEMDMKGFEAAQKFGKADKGEKIKLENTIRYGNETLEAIADAEKVLKRHSRLASGAFASNLAPQWNQYHQDLKAHLDSIGGSLLAESVKLLRESSPDGSLGMRLTEKEIFKEIQRFGALTEKASPEVLLKSLSRIRNIYQTVMEDAYNAQVQRGYVNPRSRQRIAGTDSDQWEDI